MTCSPPRAWVTDARDRRAGDSIASPRDECRPAAGAWTGFVSHLIRARSVAGKSTAWAGGFRGTGLAMQPVYGQTGPVALPGRMRGARRWPLAHAPHALPPAHRVPRGRHRQPLRAQHRRGARGAPAGGGALGPRDGPGTLPVRSARELEGDAGLRRAAADHADEPAPVDLHAAGTGLARGGLAQLRGVAADVRAPGPQLRGLLRLLPGAGRRLQRADAAVERAGRGTPRPAGR